MKKIKKIKRSAISTGLPLQGTLLSVLALDYYKASDLVVGIVYGLFGLLWIVSICHIVIEEWVDPFEDATLSEKTILGKSLFKDN